MMTVNKAGNSSSSTTKKKKTSSSSTTASTSTSKTSKVVDTKASKHDIVHSAGLSKSSSSSSLHISDVSHLPLQAHLTTYLVTETLPTGSGEKITTYHPDTGATSTEYRHFVAQDTSSEHSTDIQQIGSILNQSIQNLNESTSNLSQVSGSTYTVTEPMEELRLSYNPNDSAWNGKFIQEQTVQKGKRNSIVKQSSTASSHEEKSSSAKTTSSSYAVEIVDGKERIIDQKHHEASHATNSSNDERLDMKSGTGIEPEVHYKQKSTKISTKMDSAKPELQQPKTRSSQAVKETHQVGDNITSSTNVVQDKTVSSTHALRDKTINFIDNEITDSISKQKSSTTSTKNLGGSSNATRTVTYYDEKGNVVKTVTEVDSSATPVSEVTSSDATKTFSDQKTSNISTSRTTTDSKNFHGHVVDSSSTIHDSTGRVVKDNTIHSTTDIHTNDRLHGKSQKSSPVTSTPRKPSSPERKHPPKEKSPTKTDETTTYYVDENYCDTNKIRQSQVSSDSSDFYGHRVDSTKTVVDNVYDTSAIQNTIGYRENVVMDQNMDTTDLVFSNDRNYGKTGWNGQFTYETPQGSKKSTSPDRKSPPTEKPDKPASRRSQSPTKNPIKKFPDQLPAAGAPSRKSPEKQRSKPTAQTQDFLTTETQENIKQFTEQDTNEWTKTVDEGSSTVIEGDTTIEYFKIIDGKKIPIGQKVIPGQTTTESYDNITGRREAETTIHDSKTVEDLTEKHTRPLEKKPNRVAPEDLPAAGMPTRSPGDKKPAEQKSVIKDQKDIRRDSTTTEYIETEGDTTIEYFTIVDGKRIPAGTKVKPGGTKTELYDSTRRDSSTTIEENSKKFVDVSSTTEHYETIESNVPKGRKTSPEDLPAAGVPSRKPTDKKPTDRTSKPKDTEDYDGYHKTLDEGSSTIIEGDTTIEYFKIVDGKKIPIGQKVIPGSTTTEYYDNITGRRESKTTTHDTKMVTDNTNIFEEVISTDRRKSPEKKPTAKTPSKVSPEDLPAAGMPSRNTQADKKVGRTDQKDVRRDSTTEYTEIQGDTVIEYFDIVDGKRIPKGTKVIPGGTTTTTGRTLEKTEMVTDNTNIFEEVISTDRRKSPEKKPTGKTASKVSPEDLPAAGMPTRTQKDDRKIGRTDHKDVDRDSSTTEYIQGDTIIEYFDIVDGKRIPKGTKVIPGGTTTTTERTHESTERRDSVTNITEKHVKDMKSDSKTFVESTNIFEEYTIVDGKRVPITRDSRRPDKVSPEELSAAGMPSKKDSKAPRRSQSPEKKQPTKRYPGTTDDSTTVESFKTVSEVFDSKTTVVKDSQTFMDQESTTEHYTIVNGERVPAGPRDRRPIDDLKSPEELPAAGVPTRRPEKRPDDRSPKKKTESPSRKDKVRPEDLPAAGRPSKPDDKSVVPVRQPTDRSPDNTVDSTTIESFETVSKVFDSKTTVMKDSQTFVDRESTAEHYTVVNGERVPTEDWKQPQMLPAAGMPSRRPEKQPAEKSPKGKPESSPRKPEVRPEDLPAAGRPTQHDAKAVVPKRTPTEGYPDDTVDSTTVESFETVSKVFDSKTTVIKDSQKFVDRESTAEHYTIIDGKRVPVGSGDRRPIEDHKSPEELPAAGMPSRRPEKQPAEKSPKKKPDSPPRKAEVRPEDLPAAGRPTQHDAKAVVPERTPTEGYPDDTVDSTTVGSFETVSKVFDSKTTVIKDSQTFVDRESTAENYTIIDGKRVPVGSGDRRPIEDHKSPEELPAAGMPSRRPEKQPAEKSPKKKPDSPPRKAEVRPEDLPAAGRPTQHDYKGVVPKRKPTEGYPDDTVDSTTVESFETVSKVFDSKTTVIKDSQTFVDRESTAEHYTIIDGKRVPVGSGDRRPIEDNKSPEALPAAGMPSRRPEEQPDDRSPKKKPESPSRKDKVRPEDLPAAGRPTTADDKLVPKKKPTDKYPDSTTVESFETVSKVFDSKTTVIKDSQTFVDRESTAEYYTIVNGERVPVGPGDRKPIEPLPTAGVPSRKPQKQPDDRVPKKKPESPTKKKMAPEDFPAAGRPSKPDDRSLVPQKKPSEGYPDIVDSTTTVESSATVFDSKTTVIRDSKTFVDNQSTVEHYVIVDGERIQQRPGDRSPTEDFTRPEKLPAAGMPSRKDQKVPEDKTPKKKPKSPTRKDRIHPEDLPAAGRSSKPTDKSVISVQKTDSDTVETFETVSKVFDSKTTVIKDSQTFVDQQSNVEHYTIVNGERVDTDKRPIKEKPSRKSPDELPAAGRPSRKSPERKPKRPGGTDITTVEDITNKVVDVTKNISEDFTTTTVVENFTTDIRDVKDTIVRDTVDRIDRTFIKEDIINIKDINEVENITNIQKVSENKVIKVEKVIKEPAPIQHYKPPKKEQCICELCTCGETSTCSHK